MQKKKILFLIHYMEIGGAEQALLGLFNALDYDRVNVDLFVYWHHGTLMKYIPETVNLLPEIGAYSMLEQPMTECLMRGYWQMAFARVVAKIEQKVYRLFHSTDKEDYSGMGYIAKYASKVLCKINPDVEYDLAVSFLIPHIICQKKVSAKKKVAWIHTDYSVVSVNSRLELPVWKSFDNIVSISKDVSKSFLKTFPILAPKIVEIENIMSPLVIRRRAEVAFDDVNIGELASFRNDVIVGNKVERCSHQKSFDNVPYTCKELISVGRFAEAKNYDNVPDICQRILKKGIDVRWYLIGFGADESLIRSKIKEAGMQEYVIILGKKENPYPYIKACDIYVQPSRYEGKSVTVREAQMLYKPVVVTNYPTASSQIKDGEDGVIVPMDNEGCARGIVEFILNEEKQKHIIEYLHTHDYGNEAEVEKIYKLIEQ